MQNASIKKYPFTAKRAASKAAPYQLEFAAVVGIVTAVLLVVAVFVFISGVLRILGVVLCAVIALVVLILLVLIIVRHKIPPNIWDSALP